MSNAIKISLSILSGLVIGIFILAVITFAQPRAPLPLSVQNSISKQLGIYKPQIIGFQPYWLLNKAEQDYSAYITELAYFSLTINPDGTIQRFTKPTESEPGWNKLKSEDWENIATIATQKKVPRSLVLHLSNEADIAELLTEPESHAHTLIDEIAPLMKEYSFTDLNLDI